MPSQDKPNFISKDLDKPTLKPEAYKILERIGFQFKVLANTSSINFLFCQDQTHAYLMRQALENYLPEDSTKQDKIYYGKLIASSFYLESKQLADLTSITLDNLKTALKNAHQAQVLWLELLADFDQLTNKRLFLKLSIVLNQLRANLVGLQQPVIIVLPLATADGDCGENMPDLWSIRSINQKAQDLVEYPNLVAEDKKIATFAQATLSKATEAEQNHQQIAQLSEAEIKFSLIELTEDVLKGKISSKFLPLATFWLAQDNSKQDDKHLWAKVNLTTGLAFYKLTKGSRADNLDQAIKHYKQALEIYTKEAFPEDWSRTQNNLANALSKKITGVRATNIDQAIRYYKQALEVRTKEAFPEDWARTQNNLANALRIKITGERVANIDKAIKHYNQALEVRTKQAYPEDWAGTQNNLANAFSIKITGDRAANIDRAIKHYHQALEIYTKKAFPQQWATTQKYLAKVLSKKRE